MTLQEFIIHPVVQACFFSWLLSQAIKFFWVYNKYGTWEFGLFYRFTTGGMPSSHAALVAAAASSIYLLEGISLTFLLSLLLVIFTIHDALVSRRHAGMHARAINALMQQLGKKELKGEVFEEMLGHEPSEVIIGAVLGIMVALLFAWL